MIPAPCAGGTYRPSDFLNAQVLKYLRARTELETWLSAVDSILTRARRTLCRLKIWMCTGLILLGDAKSVINKTFDPKVGADIDPLLVGAATAVPIGGSVAVEKNRSFEISSTLKGEHVWAAKYVLLDAKFMTRRGPTLPGQIRLFCEVTSSGHLAYAREAEPPVKEIREYQKSHVARVMVAAGDEEGDQQRHMQFRPWAPSPTGELYCSRRCDFCHTGIVYNQYHYHCNRCDDGDFDLYLECVELRGEWCRQDSHATRKKCIPPSPRSRVRCSYCERELSGEYYCYHRDRCDYGDFDVCGTCLGAGMACRDRRHIPGKRHTKSDGGIGRATRTSGVEEVTRSMAAMNLPLDGGAPQEGDEA